MLVQKSVENFRGFKRDDGLLNNSLRTKVPKQSQLGLFLITLIMSSNHVAMRKYSILRLYLKDTHFSHHATIGVVRDRFAFWIRVAFVPVLPFSREMLLQKLKWLLPK